MKVTPGATRVTSSMLCSPFASIASWLSAVTLIGTSISFSTRRSAVTTTSFSSVPEPAALASPACAQLTRWLTVPTMASSAARASLFIRDRIPPHFDALHTQVCYQVRGNRLVARYRNRISSPATGRRRYIECYLILNGARWLSRHSPTVFRRPRGSYIERHCLLG